MGCSAAGCVVGGGLSDKWGRRRMLALYTFLTAVPTIWFALYLQNNGWIFPVDPRATSKPIPPHALIVAFWIASLVFNFMRGLMYGTRTALFMDLCTPSVAATQFTAYMSLLNLGIAYTAWWQGIFASRFGYPKTFLLDAVFGCAALLLLPFIRPRQKAQ
jgi:MFS transporter, PAT family, beta-lactamase induction signal transducer AmpG